MELKVSSLKPGGLSPSDCGSDPEEKEVSDEEDDDRNHKHRRRETRSQSMERDSSEPVFTRSYRKHNKPFANGHHFRENESQSSETWKNYNMNPLEKDFASKFDKRGIGTASFPRVNVDLNQRIRSNQIFSGEPGRGRGRDPGFWNQRDSRFNSLDIASQMVQQGSITPGLFAGRGLPNVPNTQNASWNTFGLIPGIHSGGLDALHSIGLPGTFRPAVNPSMSMGIPRQRCRDFEERGFCLRGDMCPMEHGVNRIVVEDVQSLSQFNLPVSLPSAPLVGTPAGSGALPSVGAPPTTLMNTKGSHGRSIKSGLVDDGMGFDGSFSGSAAGSGADLYDPDQPLWNTNVPETSSGLIALHSSKNDETDSFMSIENSGHHHVRLRDNPDNESGMKNAGIPGGSSSSSSVWGRVGGVRNRVDMKEKTDLTVNTSDHLENETKKDQDALPNIRDTSRQGKHMFTEDVGPKTVDPSAKTQNDTARNLRKSSQKALRTLFVSGIPQKSNKRDSLLSHFQKFGEVIDIYIPSNSERAFVQFSKREEAEAALKAPDAVMGNRFIKLWWANRDSIPDDGISGSHIVSVTPRGVPAASVLPHPFIASRGKDNLQSAPFKGATGPSSDVSQPPTEHPKIITNGSKVPPPSQKKKELEQLKEELRKKQELLAQKRNDFRRQLDKLEKQTAGVKGEVAETAAKRQRVGMTVDDAKATSPSSSGPVLGDFSPRAEMIVDKNKAVDNPTSSTGTRMPIRPGGLAAPPFPMNRYKLDNRPTTFRIIPPLPPGLANVNVLKEHFSSYDDLSTVELEDTEACDDNDGTEVPKSCSAHVTFTTRFSAERAFSSGKCWQGNDLQFMWLTSTSANDLSGREKTPPAPKSHVETVVSGNEEPETSERNCGDNREDLNEVALPCKNKGEEASATSVSSGEESLKSEIATTAISEEKESPTSGAS